MKVGDLVIAPDCEDPDEVGLIIDLKRYGDRIGVLWPDGQGVVGWEPPRILEVISEIR